jgi:hypothetical protein
VIERCNTPMKQESEIQRSPTKTTVQLNGSKITIRYKRTSNENVAENKSIDDCERLSKKSKPEEVKLQSNKRSNEEADTQSNKKSKLDYEEIPYIKFSSGFFGASERKEYLQSFFMTNKRRQSLLWPRNNRPITINLEDDKTHCNITIQDAKDGAMLLTLCHQSDNQLHIKRCRVNETWHEKDIHDLITIINYAFQTKISYNSKTSKYQEEIEKIAINMSQSWFENADDFLKHVNSDQSRLTTVQQFLTYHSVQSEQGNTFWIDWSQQKDSNRTLSLEVTVSIVSFKSVPQKTDYYSWIFAEKEFLKLHDYDQEMTLNYHHVSVSECFTSKIRNRTSMGKNLLDFWFSLDSNFGELRDLHKGKVLRGTDGMAIFDLLNNLFKIKNIYLCDASRTTNQPENSPGQIVLRVLMSVAYGKTWYERYGYKPLTFQGMQHGWYDEEGPGPLNQNAEVYYHARTQLRAMSPIDLEKIFLAEEQQLSATINQPVKQSSEILKNLREKYDPGSKMNLGDLTAAVYNANKNQFKSNDLLQMYELLTLPVGYDEGKKEYHEKPTFQFNQLLSKIVYTKFFKKTKTPELATPEVVTTPPKSESTSTFAIS